jgi:hypothetical protein
VREDYPFLAGPSHEETGNARLANAILRHDAPGQSNPGAAVTIEIVQDVVSDQDDTGYIMPTKNVAWRDSLRTPLKHLSISKMFHAFAFDDGGGLPCR